MVRYVEAYTCRNQELAVHTSHSILEVMTCLALLELYSVTSCAPVITRTT